MSRKTKISAFKEGVSSFGASVSNMLAEANQTQSSVASAMGISQPYLHQMMTGKRRVSPQWAELIADVLRVSESKRKKLHRAAALDNGFKL